MNDRQLFISQCVDSHRNEILEAERWIWKHPQVGYTEWEANEYLIEKFEDLGYSLVRADQDSRYGKIPGFYTDIDTGREGPCVCIMGELDALDISNHPESVCGMTHCCGHNVQAAGVLGIAAALKEPHALDGLCGKIRLMLVPAEELIQIEFRQSLREKGIINYFGGKIEFLYRGYFDDVDMSLMVHTTNSGNSGYDFLSTIGSNGILAKTIKYVGKSSHAGAFPQDGINAQNAAMLGLQACNDLRETLQEKDTVRFHPIMKGVKSSVNIIPDEMVIETYVRAQSLEAMIRENKKFNRALAGGALAMGARVIVADRPGYSPETHDSDFMKIVENCCADLVGKEKVHFDYTGINPGSSDFGDLSTIMPAMQFQAAGASGSLHGIDFRVADPERACINAAKVQLFIADALLCNDAYNARTVLSRFKPQFATKKDYFACIDKIEKERDLVHYLESGDVEIRLQ